MKTALAGSFLASLFIAAPLHGQAVSADVVVSSGPVAGRVMLRDEYSSYSYPRRVVVVERSLPRVIVVERMRRGHYAKHWKRHGYRPVVVYYANGRYYDRRYITVRGLRRVVVYERAGRFYRDYHERHGWDD
jgi:hypothetical protein